MVLGRWLEGGVIIFIPEFIWFTSHLLRHFKGRFYYYDCTSLQTMWCCSLSRRTLCQIASVQQKLAKNTVALIPISGITALKLTSDVREKWLKEKGSGRAKKYRGCAVSD